MCDLHLGFIVSAACNPIPHWLVQRVQNGEFVEMRELLANNILYNQLEDFCGHPLVSAPVYGRFPRFHHGCTALQRTWKSLHRTLRLVRCWPTAGSLFVRHSGMYNCTFRCQWICFCLDIRLFLVCRQLPF